MGGAGKLGGYKKMKTRIEVSEGLPGEWDWELITPGFPTMSSGRSHPTEARARAEAERTAVEFALEVEDD